MKIAIAGITGFIGGELRRHFEENGYEVIPILRNNFENGIELLTRLIEDCDVVVNVAGAPIARRWTSSYKKEMERSRIVTTRKLVEAIKNLNAESRPDVYISASAIGIYSSEGNNDEMNFSYGEDFLAKLCLNWESEASKVSNYGVRLIITRFGVVLGRNGGMLPMTLKIFRIGMGGKIASGDQGFSFIHINDLMRGIRFLTENNKASGIFNLVAPNPVNNAEFTETLASLLNSPSFMTVPGFALQMIFSEAAGALTKGPLVYPRRLLNLGFEFRFPDLHSALSDLVSDQ